MRNDILQEDAGWLSGVIFPDGSIYTAKTATESHPEILWRLRDLLIQHGVEFAENNFDTFNDLYFDENSITGKILGNKGIVTWIVEFMEDGSTHFSADYYLTPLQKEALRKKLPGIIARESHKYRKHPREPDKPVNRALESEETEDSDLAKEMATGTPDYPEFKLKLASSSRNERIFRVEAAADFIGALSNKENKWFVSYVPRLKTMIQISVNTPEEGAEMLWQDHLGLIKIPEIKPPYEPLPPVPDDPNHYENIRIKASNLVDYLVDHDYETEGTELPETVRQLQETGFRVTSCVGDKIKFSWPADNRDAYFNGVRRAREVVSAGVFVESSHKNRLAEMTLVIK